MDTQEKFTRMLTALVESANLDLLQDSEWSNTGTFRVQAPDSFGDLLTLRYNFQTHGIHTFVLARPGKPPVDLYARGSDLNTILMTVQAAIPQKS